MSKKSSKNSARRFLVKKNRQKISKPRFFLKKISEAPQLFFFFFFLRENFFSRKFFPEKKIQEISKFREILRFPKISRFWKFSGDRNSGNPEFFATGIPEIRNFPTQEFQNPEVRARFSGSRIRDPKSSMSPL